MVLLRYEAIDASMNDVVVIGQHGAENLTLATWPSNFNKEWLSTEDGSRASKKQKSLEVARQGPPMAIRGGDRLRRAGAARGGRDLSPTLAAAGQWPRRDCHFRVR